MGSEVVKKKMRKKKGKAIIVGGSITGLSCAHALILAGWDVLVLEKSSTPPKGSPTGAGVALEPRALRIIGSWIAQPQLLQEATVPVKIDVDRAIDGETKVSKILARDENLNYRAIHWADLHDLLYSSLPPEIFLWGHMYQSFSISEDKISVGVKAQILQTNEIIEINGDLLIAADGCQSSIRKAFLPELELRYSGYCAWRGVTDISGRENSETMLRVQKAYPDLGKCLYFDLSPGNHCVLYEIPNKRLNWLWYVNVPEPELKGNSVTMKATSDMIKNMYQEAAKIWVPEFVRLMKDTKEPFLNFIYDCDPLEQIFWDNVVLVGDAAHPTTPHCARSTNMAIVDAAVLGKCLEKWGLEDLPSALQEYQLLRQPVTSKQVLHSRLLGQIKQGLSLPDRKPFYPMCASSKDCNELLFKNMPFFDSVPI